MRRKILDGGDRVTVWGGSIVEMTVVTSGAPASVFFGERRKEAQGLLDLRMMPICSISINYLLAMASSSGGRGRACVWEERPVVGMNCWTPCLTAVEENIGCSMDGKSCKILLNLLDYDSIGASCATAVLPTEQGEVRKVSASISRRPLRSTRRLC